MTSNRFMYGAFMLLLVVASVFAGDIPTGETFTHESDVMISPVNENGTIIRINVLTYNRTTTSASGSTNRDRFQLVVEDCKAKVPASGLSKCIMEEGQKLNAGTGYDLDFRSVKDARVSVLYYNIIAADFTAIQTCENIRTTERGEGSRSSAGGAQEEIPLYYIDCDITPAVAGQPGRTTLQVQYYPESGSGIQPSSAPYYFSNLDANAAQQFTQNLNNLITGALERSSTSLPCIGVFLVLGLLLSSLYFAGKSPVTLLDITTPRVPMPKGVSAGGQILLPFGYTEMKRVTKAKMGAAAGASLLSMRKAFGKGGAAAGGDAATSRLLRQVSDLKGTRADRFAGDVAENKKMAEALIRGGRSLGMSAKELEHLANLPYHYGDAEHRTVAKIIGELEKKGGRHALAASTMRDYFLGQRTFQSLESLTGHNAVGQRDTIHYAVSSKLGKAFGVNRYAIIGGFVPGMYDSTIRTGKIVTRGTKEAIKGAGTLARGMTRTTMEMLGGRHMVADMEARAKTSAVGAWLAKKHPSEIVIGQAFPVNDKAAHLYRTVKEETLKDQMRYVLRQFYKKLRLNFAMSDHELANMGHEHLDILEKAGYNKLSAAQLSELKLAEAEIRKILSGSGDSFAKLSDLAEVARKHGATLDGQVFSLAQEVLKIEQSAHPEHMKLVMLQEQIESQNNVRLSVNTGGMAHEDQYICHVGGGRLKGSQVWETMVLRTMVWDGENGHLQGGIKEEFLSARLNVVNRLATLDPLKNKNMHELPEHMRNEAALQAVTAQNKKDMIQLFSEEGKQMFQEVKGKSMGAASISEIVDFMYGGKTPKTGHIDPATKKMVWWEADEELGLHKGATLVDVKRHWVSGLDSRENYAIGQWIESRFTRSYVPPYKASIEAELDRRDGSANWSVKQRTNEAKKQWVLDQLSNDMEQRFNSHFGQNTYGTTRETVRFYAGAMAGFMEKALHEKGMSKNNPEMRFLEEMDTNSPKHLSKLSQMLQTHSEAYERVVSRPITYDDIAKSDRAMVMFHEGGLGYYKKNMMLSDQDRILGGEVALWDGKQHRKFIPEDVAIRFGNRDDLMREFNRVAHSKQESDWTNLMGNASKWVKQAATPVERFEREKVYAATAWQFANTTHNYADFWQNSSVSVQAKRATTPAAPSVMRFFGAEAPNFTQNIMRPFRDIGLHAGDYVSKVALAAGGSTHTASYDVTPVSEYYKQHSWQLASKIMSEQGMEDLSKEEKVAYRNVAMHHHAYNQTWDYVIDRNPWRMSTSFGTQQGWGAFFHFGPAANFSVKDNLRAYLGRGEYANFMAGYGFPMNLAGKMMAPYTNMIRGLQMSMQGYASKWDSTPDALRQWNYTQPRLLEAMQAVNPFAFKWFPGKTGERIASLNKFGGSLEKHQLAGPDFNAGLRQAPQDIFLQKKGVYANARTGGVNPASSFYDYRHTMQLDAPMAEYMLRTKEATYMYDANVQRAAWDTTTRRTVSAEALAIRRDQELRGFGAMANPLMGWANPIAFMWHMPVPLWPTSITPRDMASKFVARSKGVGGYGGGISGMARSAVTGSKRVFQPHLTHMVVDCPKCSRRSPRGNRCQCGNILY
jgi:hypothetical protein